MTNGLYPSRFTSATDRMAAVKRTPFAGWPCSIARTVDLIGDWWTPLVLREAFLGRRRFDEMQKNLGIGRNVLAQRLRRLTDAGMVERVKYQDRPARWEYVLTPKGRDFFPVLAAMVRCGAGSTKSRSRAAWTSVPLMRCGAGGSGRPSRLANRKARAHSVNADTRLGDSVGGSAYGTGLIVRRGCVLLWDLPATRLTGRARKARTSRWSTSRGRGSRRSSSRRWPWNSWRSLP